MIERVPFPSASSGDTGRGHALDPMRFPKLKLFSRSGRDPAQGHMTFGQTSLGRNVSRTGMLLKRQLWIWPIAAVVLLAIVGYTISTSIHQTMENNLHSELHTLLTVEKSMLERWFKVQESSALTMANNREVRKTVAQLLAVAAEATPALRISRRRQRASRT